MPSIHPAHRPTHLAVVAALLGAALSLTFSASPAQANEPAPAVAKATLGDADQAAAQALFNRAAQGEESAIAPAVEAWRKLSAADPTNPLPRAYLGAVTAMQAMTTLLPWKKMSHVEDGLALLDKALAQLTPAHDLQLANGVPASLVVRFNAASTFNSLPSMFNRGDRGAKLLSEVLQSPLFDKAPAGFKAAVWMRAAHDAQAAKHPDEARQWLNKVVASGTPLAAAAQAQLKGM